MSNLARLMFVVLASCGGETNVHSRVAPQLAAASESPLLVLGPPLTALRVRDGEVLLQALASSETPRVATPTDPWVVWADGDELRAQRPFEATGSPLVTRSPAGAHPITALHCRGLRCLVGRFGQVDRIHLGEQAPAFELVQNVGTSSMKPIDFFVTMGDEVIAVDDMILPKWALVLDADWNHLRSVSLPSAANEVILAAAAHGQALVLMSGSVSTGGRFQRIATCELSQAEATCEYPYEEWMDGRNALSDFTEWHGMAMAGSDILLAAGERGLLRVSLEDSGVHFSTDYGNVLDVVRAAGSVYLLVERDGARLVALDADAQHVMAAWPLSRPFSRFAH